jgi:hypothetical protein
MYSLLRTPGMDRYVCSAAQNWRPRGRSISAMTPIISGSMRALETWWWATEAAASP